MVEHLSFEEVALELNCSISKVRQLVIQDRQLKATRFTTNGIELETTANDSHFPYNLDFCSHLSDEGKITSDVYEMGKTGITKVLDSGHLYIKRADLHTYIAASGRAVGTEPVPSNNAATGWPWGSHHTERLGHLEAAARRFWVNYDPSDHGTAPTNAVVSAWLQKERKATPTTADSIATMLRPDNLPTGPRK
jgi:hypothetical protein